MTSGQPDPRYNRNSIQNLLNYALLLFENQNVAPQLLQKYLKERKVRCYHLHQFVQSSLSNSPSSCSWFCDWSAYVAPCLAAYYIRDDRRIDAVLISQRISACATVKMACFSVLLTDLKDRKRTKFTSPNSYSACLTVAVNLILNVLGLRSREQVIRIDASFVVALVADHRLRI